MGRWGGGGGGADGGGNSRVVWGGNSAVGGVGGNSGGRGSTVGGGSTSKNRSSHHNYRSAKQFELKQSWKALRALNARWALPVYPVFEDEKSKASDKKSVKRKMTWKKTDRTNIVAANFFWEQLTNIVHAFILVFILDNTFSWKLCYSVVHIKLYSSWKKNFVALGQASKNLIYAQLQLKISLFYWKSVRDWRLHQDYRFNCKTKSYFNCKKCCFRASYWWKSWTS